jgi:PilZ domain
MPAARRAFSRERRSVIRHKISVPLKHRVWKSSMSEQSALAVDISERGIQFVTDWLYPDGEIVELRFEMPEAVAGESPSEWLCTGHVVRVRQIGTTAKMKVGVQFDCYEVTR